MIKVQPASEFVDGESQGFFALPNDVYRKATGVSQSTIKRCLRSPQHSRKPWPKSKVMDIGSLAHALLLEPETFQEDKSHIIRPKSYPSEEKGKTTMKPWNGNSLFCKGWLMDAEQKGLPVINERELATINGMVASFKEDPLGAMFMDNGFKEVSAFWRDPVSEEMLKSRFDLLAETKNEIWCGDAKTTDNGEENEWKWIAKKLHAPIQADFYRTILNGITGSDSIRFVFGTIETDEPYMVDWYEISPEDLQTGHNQWRTALMDLIAARRTNDFVRIRTIQLPKY